MLSPLAVPRRHNITSVVSMCPLYPNICYILVSSRTPLIFIHNPGSDDYWCYDFSLFLFISLGAFLVIQGMTRCVIRPSLTTHAFILASGCLFLHRDIFRSLWVQLRLPIYINFVLNKTIWSSLPISFSKENTYVSEIPQRHFLSYDHASPIADTA